MTNGFLPPRPTSRPGAQPFIPPRRSEERLSSHAASRVDPEAVSRQKKLALSIGITTDAVRADEQEARFEERSQLMEEAFDKFPLLRRVASDGQNPHDRASLLYEDAEQLRLASERISRGREQQRFFEQSILERNIITPGRSGLTLVQMAAAGAEISEAVAGLQSLTQRGAPTENRPLSPFSFAQNPALTRARQEAFFADREGLIEKIRAGSLSLQDAKKTLESLPRDIEFEEAQRVDREEGGLSNTLSALLDDPARIVRLSVEGTAVSLPMFAAGILAGPVGAAAGSLSIESTLSTMDFLRKEGIDFAGKSPEQILQIFSNPETRAKIAEAERKGALKGAGVAAFDLAGAWVASRVLSPTVIRGRPLGAVERGAINVIAQVPVQGVSEAAGEGLGQFLATGEIDLVDVFLEGVAGAGMSVADVAVFGGREAALRSGRAVDTAVQKRRATRTLEAKSQQTSDGLDAVDEFIDMAQSTKLAERDPELLEAYAKEASKDGIDQIYVAPEAIEEYAGADLDAVLERIGVSREDMEDASFRGGYVEVRVSRLVADPEAKSFLAAVKDNAKVAYDGVTSAESQAIREMDDATFQAAVQALTTPSVDDGGQAVYEDVFQQVMDTGRFSESQARSYATLWRSAMSTIAQRSGQTADALYERVRPQVGTGAVQQRDARTALMVTRLRAKADRAAGMEEARRVIAEAQDEAAVTGARETLSRLEAEEAASLPSRELDALEERVREAGIDVRTVSTPEVLSALEARRDGQEFEQTVARERFVEWTRGAPVIEDARVRDEEPFEVQVEPDVLAFMRRANLPFTVVGEGLIQVTRTVAETAVERIEQRARDAEELKDGENIVENEQGELEIVQTRAATQEEKDEANDLLRHATDAFGVVLEAEPDETFALTQGGRYITGKPVVAKVYHGSSAPNIETFAREFLGSATGAASAEQGFFFAGDPNTSNTYAGYLIEAGFQSLYERMTPLERSMVSRELMKEFSIEVFEEGKNISIEHAPTSQKLVGLQIAPIAPDEVTILWPGRSPGKAPAVNGLISDELIENVSQNAATIFMRQVTNEPYVKALASSMGIQVDDELAPVNYPAYVRMNNPLVHDFGGRGYRDVTYFELLRRAKKGGHDGVILTRTRDGGETDNIFVVFEPEDIAFALPVGRARDLQGLQFAQAPVDDQGPREPSLLVYTPWDSRSIPTRADLQAERDAMPERVRQYAEEKETQARPDDIGEPTRNSDGSYRVNANGDITGAPPGVKTESDIDDLVTRITRLMADPLSDLANSAMWYHDSGRAIRDITGGDPIQMERMVRTMALLSADNQVGGNVTAAIKAAYLLLEGRPPAAGRYPQSVASNLPKILRAREMSLDLPGVERKVLSFYRNLWDSTFLSNRFEESTTMDLWMARLYGYPEQQRVNFGEVQEGTTNKLGVSQYKFANMVTKRVAKRFSRLYGIELTPAQTQAVLWTYQRNKDTGLDPSQRSTFATYVDRARQHITVEAITKRTSVPLHLMSDEQRQQYTDDVYGLLLDRNGGVDLFAYLGVPLGSLSGGSGAYESQVNPGLVADIIPLKVEGVTDTEKADLASLVLMYAFTQDAVPWQQFDPTRKGKTTGWSVRLSRELSLREQSVFLAHLQDTMNANDKRSAKKRASSPAEAGFSIINGHLVATNFRMGDDGPTFALSDAIYGRAFTEAVNTYDGPGAEAFSDTIEKLKVRSAYHDVTTYHPEGWAEPQAALEALEGEISRRGSPALRSWARSLRGRVSRLNEEWGRALQRGATAARVGDSPSVRADGRIELHHWSNTQGIAQLEPGQYGTAFAGQERARKAQEPKAWVDRTYYGLEIDREGGYSRESGLGLNHYVTSIAPERLYDFAGDPQGLRGDLTLTEYERAVRDAGYAGYWTDSPLGRAAAVFEPLKPEGEFQEFFQSEQLEQPAAGLEQKDRGRFSISADRTQRIISVLEDADASTFLHESAHFFLELLRDLDNAGQYDRGEVEAIFNFLGVSSWDEVGTTQHEMWAEGFEKYLFEGNAPSEELRSVFRRFRDWMRSIYQSLRTIGLTGVKLDDEARAIYDRLLATDDAIDAEVAKSEYLPLFRDTRPEGMTEAEYERYRGVARESVERAREKLMQRLMKDITRRRNKERRARLQEVTAETELEVRRERVWQALEYLRNRRLIAPEIEDDEGVQYTRLDEALVVATVGAEALPLLPAITVKKGGADPEEVAATFGFPSGTELLQAIASLGEVDQDGNVTYRTVAQEARRRAEARLDAGEGTSLDPTRIQAEAAEAMHGVERGELIAIELRALEQLRAERVTRRGAERTVAAEGAGSAAERRSDAVRARERVSEAETTPERQDAARQAILARQREEVARAQREADRVSRSRANEALRARQATFREMARRYVAGMAVGDLERLGRVAQDERRAAHEAAAAVARGDYSAASLAKQRQLFNHFLYLEAVKAREALGVARRLFTRWAKRKPKDASVPLGHANLIHTVLAAHNVGPKRIDPDVARAQMENVRTSVAGMNADGSQIVIPDSVYNARNFETITVEEANALKDAVRSLVHDGRRNSEEARQAFNQEMEELGEGVRKQVGVRRDREELGLVRRGVRDAFDILGLSHRKAEHLLLEVDGFEELGPMWRAVFAPIQAAADAEGRMRHEAMQALRDVWKRLGKLTSKHRTRKTSVGGLNLTREQMIVIGLNWGNEGNREALLNGSRRWNRDQLERVIAELTDEEWDFIESVWSYIGSYWPQIAALEERMTGLVPEQVEGEVFQLPSGRVIAGQYYPIKFDPKASPPANADAVQDQARQLMSGDYSRSHTSHGFTNERVGSKDSGKRVHLSLDVMFRHVDEVIHDLSHREAVVQVHRVLNSRPVQQALADRYGVDANRYLNRWLKNVAAGTVEPVDWRDIILRHLRVGMSIAEMGLSIRTALVQPLGITQTVARIGVAQTLKGVAMFIGDSRGNPFARVGWVNERSAQMLERGLTFDRDIAAAARRLKPGNRIDRLRDASFWMISKLDMMVAYSSWLGAYDLATQRGMGEDDAVSFADQIVRTTQGSGAAKDLAVISSGGEGARLFTGFMTFFSAYHNMVVDASKRTGKIAREDGVLYATPYAAGQFFMLVVAPALLSALALDGGPDEDDGEEWWAWATKLVVAYGLSGMIIVRDLASGATSDFGYSGPTGVRPLVTVIDTYKQVEQGEVDKALMRGVMMSTGYLAHLPTRQAWRTAEALWDYTEGDIDAAEAAAATAGLRHFK